ncbi:MAG: 30S ribosomal protein S18 [Chloroflexota bacterium]
MADRRRTGGPRFQRRRMDPLAAEGIEHVDYKDVQLLRQFISDLGKIEPRRRRGTSAKHQRSLATAIKRARHLALLPFVDDGRSRQRDQRRGGRGGRRR